MKVYTMAEGDTSALSPDEPDNTCLWYPNSPECVDDTASDIVVVQYERYSSFEVLLSQLGYLFVAAFEVAVASMIQFRYRKQDWNGLASDDYYKSYEKYVNSTNWWSIANMMHNFSKIGIYGIAFTTQLLTMVGVLPLLNTVVWYYGVIVGLTAIEIFYLLLNGYAYDSAVYKCRQEGNSDACTVAATIEYDWDLFFGLSAFSGSTLFMGYEMWLQGQDEAAGPSQKEQSQAE